ncbi:hypothetical protein C0993_010015 [Termitomyces sp. T159_Od127]|nr:hypothetical protein C0993_010015 [Termitomyces sp. T159_Od127]
MFRALWLPLLAVLAVSVTRAAQPIQRAKRTTVPNTPFITIHDGQFVVNGSVFKVNGTNAYWLSALNNETDIDNTLASIRAANLTVVRTWAFNDVDEIPENGTWFQLIRDGKQFLNTGPNGLQKLDKVIELAQKHGLYVVLSLTNNWSANATDPRLGINQTLPDGFNLTASNTTLPRNTLSNSYGGMDTYVRNFGGPQEHDQFFTNQTLINAFMNYTTQIVTRYLNKTNVFAWELANDPRCNSTLANNDNYCVRLFDKPPPPPPPPQVSPAPGSRRSIPEPQSKAKHLKERKAAWKKQRERQKRAGVQPDGVKIRGRWTASQTKRQSELNRLMSAFDGSHGVDSADILSIPQIGFSSFQLFPDQFNYSQNAPDPTLPAFNQTLQVGLDWIELHADLAALFNKPVVCTGFGLVTQRNSPFFVPFNSINASFAPDSTTSMNATQPFGVTDTQRDDAYKQWIQQGILGGLQGMFQYQWSQDNLTAQPGTAVSPTNNETSESPVATMTSESPNDGYGMLNQA